MQIAARWVINRKNRYGEKKINIEHYKMPAGG
jgi:hypothetical protein